MTLEAPAQPQVAEGAGTRQPPVLWHLKVSHYNEKARWALDHKGIPHLRRAVTPGPHRAVARRLCGGSTLPVLVLDGRAIGDSTEIVAELERRCPRRPLYPEDPAERRRVLDLEEFFDEQLGPHSRLLLLHHLMPDGKLLLSTFAPDLGRRRRAWARVTFPLVRRQISRSFAIEDDSVELAFERLDAVGERFRTELQPSGYLSGNRFTVADLTLASLLAPLVAPEQFPYAQPQRGHPRLAPLRDVLAQSGLLRWTQQIYAIHRGSSAEIVSV